MKTPANIDSTNATAGRQGIYTLGYTLLAASFLLYVLTDYFIGRQGGNNFTLFFLHYFIAIFYGGALMNDGSLGLRESWRKSNVHKTALILQLFLISAYALNREVSVFEDSSNWLCVFLIVSSTAILSLRFTNLFPKSIRAVQFVVVGSGLLLYLYLALYVAEVYIIGTFCVLGIGIGAHVYVPIFILINVVLLLKELIREKAVSPYWLVVGCLLSVSIVATFTSVWTSRVNAIEKLAGQFVLNEQQDLPVWVTVGQTAPNDWITEKILKSNLVYSVAGNPFEHGWFSFRSKWNEPRKHDPLVFIASIFGTCTLSDDDRVKILKSIFDNRHHAEERLRSGDNLVTSYLVNDVDIYPDLRLTYTEKYLNIRNTSKGNGRGSTQEAIYIFQLPEGSVVTSLSLWINGTEEKSVLTSKQKAAKAYTTVVGVERRDPSVVHWQEGNTISVRVFPCTRAEERKFKIGITSPIPEQDGNLIYKNILFNGPNPTSAKETTRIRFISPPEDLSLSPAFRKDKKGDYILEQTFEPDQSISFKALPLKPNQFSFNGNKYSLAPYDPEFQKVKLSKIFLDINNSWNKGELDTLHSRLPSQDIFVYTDGEFQRLNPDNWSEVTSDLLSLNFSLFPFHLLSDTDHSLVISKGKELTPHLHDFNESKFASGISQYFSKNKRVKVFNLPGGVSTYVSSFRELRGLEFAEGNIDQLTQWLTLDIFPNVEETEGRIILHDAKMVILKTGADSLSKDNAPDHLARLFTYNDILRKVGSNYFKDNYINEALVDEAAMAHVVSPVSSLIVLENQFDYDRFGIKDTENGLHNASKQSSGAVPEPHEWALILVFAVLILFTIRTKYTNAPSI